MSLQHVITMLDTFKAHRDTGKNKLVYKLYTTLNKATLRVGFTQWNDAIDGPSRSAQIR